MLKTLKSIYKTRYTKEDEERKEAIWRILCESFLQKFVPAESTVLDIAAGHCEFINHIKAGKKYANDIDDRIKDYVQKDVKVIICDARKLPENMSGSIDVVFMGCLLEHMPSKESIIELFKSVKKVLRRDGRLIILNPNIRFSYAEFWDYFDHITPVSDRSVVEILEAMGFKIEMCIPKFVPNTIKDKLPQNPYLVKAYLHMPFLFPVFGKQMFITAIKSKRQ